PRHHSPVPPYAILALDGLRPRDGGDAASPHRALAALGAACLQARRRHLALGDHLLRISPGLYPLRRDLRSGRLALRTTGARRLGLDARLALALSLGLHPAGGEFRRRDEFRDVPDVLLLLRALSLVEAARGRLG